MSAGTTCPLQPAFVLHTMPYRETSVISRVLLADQGLVSVLARGARAPKSRLKGLIQPFVPLLMSCKGRGELKTLTQAEAIAIPLTLHHHHLFSGLYINELLMKLLQPEQPIDALFTDYRNTLIELSAQAPLQPLLRHFEKRLLQWLGLAPSFTEEAQTSADIVSQAWYALHCSRGFTLPQHATEQPLYSGQLLLALAKEAPLPEALWPSAKRLFRTLMDSALEGRVLRSRALFHSLGASNERMQA